MGVKLDGSHLYSKYNVLRYSELTPAQKKLVCNGCGGKGGKLNPPQWCFKASCHHHDFLYWVGGSEKDRLRADRLFLKKMKEDARNSKWFLIPGRLTGAYTYYIFVRTFGKKYFRYTSIPYGKIEMKMLELKSKSHPHP